VDGEKEMIIKAKWQNPLPYTAQYKDVDIFQFVSDEKAVCNFDGTIKYISCNELEIISYGGENE
jgi:hypothetical protein